jgi:peptidoglycan/xylan/chitin deacetylase (PgdA/CDA1 family)
VTAGVVALTFDTEHPDGPRCPPGVAERIVSLLRDNGVRASFFLQGRWATAYPELARQLTHDGHVVGNHSHAHANLRHFGAAGLAADIGAAGAAIAQSAGVDPRPWFRCPHGTHSHGPQLEPTLRELGYHDAHWNITPEDWDPDVTAAEIAARAVDGITHHPGGAVVLLHSWPAMVPDALVRIIDHVGEHAGRFVTMADLPRDPSWLRSSCD